MANLLLIRDLCKKKGVTIRELANRIEITESALQALIKNGSTNTTTLEKISAELDVSAGIFFDNPHSFSMKNVSNNTSSPVIGNDAKIGDHNFNNTQASESLGYQEIIKTYQEHSNKLLSIIEKLTEKYGN
jgi:transcriptional regulator with XRE-family HTH domain